MKSLKKTCGLWLLVFALCALFVGAVVWQRFELAAIPGGLIGGGILWVAIAYLSGVGSKMKKARQIRSTLAGEPWRDGEIAAIAGRIMPIGETLVSPFTRTPCAAYTYQIRKPQGRNTHPWEFRGVAITRCAVQGTHGSLEILAVPALDVPENFCRGDEAIRNAGEYVAAAEFTMPVPFKPENVTPPPARFDHQMPNAERDLQRTMLYERAVKPGQQVCVFGRYSAAGHGLTHENDSIVPSLTLMEGDGDAILRTLARRSLGNAIAGICFIAIVVAGLLFLYAKVPLAAAEQMQPDRRTWWWEVRLDRWMQRTFDDVAQESKFTPTLLGSGEARGRIDAGDREVSPQSASVVHDANNLRVTLDDASGAVASFLIDDTAHVLTHVELLGNAVPTQDASLDLISVNDDSVEGRLTYLGPNARCRVAFKAAFTSSR